MIEAARMGRRLTLMTWVESLNKVWQERGRQERGRQVLYSNDEPRNVHDARRSSNGGLLPRPKIEQKIDGGLPLINFLIILLDVFSFHPSLSMLNLWFIAEIHVWSYTKQWVLLGQYCYPGLQPFFGANRSLSIPCHWTTYRLKTSSSASLDADFYSHLRSSRICSSHLRDLKGTPKAKIENIPSSLKDIGRTNFLACWK